MISSRLLMAYLRQPCPAWGRVLGRRGYHYKPKDRHNVYEDQNHMTKHAKDNLLYHYENPKRLLFWNVAAAGTFTCWTYTSYTMYQFYKKDFALIKDSVEQRQTRSYGIMKWFVEKVTMITLISDY